MGAPGRGLGRFVSVASRPWADACETENAPYIEGWWVDPDLRLLGVGKALVSAVVGWCREQGHGELASNSDLDNHGSSCSGCGSHPATRLHSP